MYENREIPVMLGGDVPSGRAVKGYNPTTAMYVPGKSEEGVVPVTSLNKADKTVAVVTEGRPERKGNSIQPMGSCAQEQVSPSSGLERVRMAASKDRGMRFTSLLHHVTPAFLAECYWELNPRASAGVDGVTMAEYENDLPRKLAELADRVHAGTYRAQPSRRVWIPKADGRQRPLGVAAMEDKIVQRAVTRILEAVYEVEFKGFSYGFRPGRSAHHALDALWQGLTGRPVNWIVDADIKGFFDALDHEWLMKFIEHRIADQRILRLIRKWLRSGVCESGRWTGTTQGVPQGAVISPLLANIYLHYVLDLWVGWWRRTQTEHEVIIVRYADDFVVGFQHPTDARRFLEELRTRLGKFNLELHPDKTRLIEFGRFATANRRRRQEGRPETFNFLGFTHIVAKRRSDGQYTIHRHTISTRLSAKVKAISQNLKRMRELPIAEHGKWLQGVVQGWLNYHAIPSNSNAISRFRGRVIDVWRRMLQSRSQTANRTATWDRMRRLAERYIPPAKILHPYPAPCPAATT